MIENDYGMNNYTFVVEFVVSFILLSRCVGILFIHLNWADDSDSPSGGPTARPRARPYLLCFEDYVSIALHLMCDAM